MTAVSINDRTMVPDLLQHHPAARAVLDRYGLRGCGGPRGPVESLGFFARVHGVELGRLLEEIRHAIASGSPAEAPPASVADTIYRRYFFAGIITALTVGAGWGVWLLWQIGFAANFTGVSIHDVNAHGHAQIFGWVGLFIMGFGYQAFPRMWHTSLAGPRLAVVAFAMMLVGILIRTPAMALHDQGWAVPTAMIGGAMQLAAIAIFAGQIIVTWRRAKPTFEPSIAFIVAALAFFAIQAAFSLSHTWNTMTAGTREQLLWYVATYQAVLRDLQIHGLALLMILGVSLRMLPGFFGLPKAPARRAWVALALLLLAVVGESAFFVALRWTGNHAWASGLFLSWLMLAVGSLIIPWTWRLWRPLPDSDRSGKFIRAAYGWLAVSMAMLMLLPVYQIISSIPFSHAYYGAIRHAITVGFVSLMIMGVAAKVVPTLNGVDTRALSALWGPFLLVNLGCFLRVSLQTLTDWHPLFFGVVGVSGVLEIAGLAWWGLHLVRVMHAGKRDAIANAPASPAPQHIDLSHRVADVLAWFPQTEPAFVALGFAAVRNPLLRRTVARHTTLAQAAVIGGIPLHHMVEKLNSSARLSTPATVAGSSDTVPLTVSCTHRPGTRAHLTSEVV